jgi:hypothetical protein
MKNRTNLVKVIFPASAYRHTTIVPNKEVQKYRMRIVNIHGTGMNVLMSISANLR